MRLTEIARLVGGEISGDDTDIRNVAKIEDAEEGSITFIANLKYKKHLATTRAAAILIATNSDFEELRLRKTPVSLVRVADPYRAFLSLIDIFHPPVQLPAPGIHPSAVVAQSATICAGASIGAHTVIGERSTIGEHTTIFPGTVIGDDVLMGKACLVYANVTVRERCVIGNGVILHSGTVIGSDGFGFAPKDDGSYEKIPQRGIVVIEDEVEIGANCTIDRATLGQTVIRHGTKLDNLIHIAHNVVIGEHTVIAAQTGISGSSRVGKYCQMGGQVGLTGHITIADKTTIGAQSGVPKSITEPGKVYFGYPAREIHETWRIEGALRQLPQLLYEFRNLQKRLEELEQTLKNRSKEPQ